MIKLSDLLADKQKATGKVLNKHAIADDLRVSFNTVDKYLKLPHKHHVIEQSGVKSLFVQVGG